MLARNNRLLIVDDNHAIHDDFRKVLGARAGDAELAAAESVLFGATPVAAPEFALTLASQGEEAVDLVRAAMEMEQPFAVAFLDIRMPPGIDGIETARRLWQIDPELQVVICSAYSDYSWSDMAAKLGAPERWVLLKKPFENIEVLQLAASLTEKRSLQQVANARRADLERLVAERTERLQRTLAQLERESAERTRAEEERRAFERKFEQAQRLESLGVLAGGVAHDFNNILTGILGRAALARDRVAAGSELAGHLRAIELCARRAAELCEQMLAYAGRTRGDTCDIDVNQLVRETQALVEAAVARDIEFGFDLESAAPVVQGDAARLRQVIMNVLLNAAEALGAGPRRVSLSTRTRGLRDEELAGLTFADGARPDDFAVIQVSDTGGGMDAETMRRIFEPFFTTKFEGRGLGLCAVLGIVRSHGGALEVRSVPGEGTTFRVFLPLASGAKAEPRDREVAAKPPRSAARVLVVDDEECVRLVLAESLRRNGCEVTTANDGLEAVELLKRAPAAVDALVMDLTMPRMNGVEALTAIRALRPELPAVLISGHAQQRLLDQIRNSEVTVALQKPFDIEQLCASVAAVLGRGGRGQ